MRPYPAAVMLEAQQLHHEGWSPWQVHDILKRRHGAAPSYATVQRWCLPALREHVLAYSRDYKRRMRATALSTRLRGSSPEFMRDVVGALFAEGIPATSVAKAMRALCPSETWTRERVIGLREEPTTPIPRRRVPQAA